ncbi:mechanosensitive ion channel family protein [Candidatus Solirubrobacter pratensis]|uniref:mechanosensitive ion channel family protein n=1 Tax=Candidatus Solirubrobacter pratensis TaxID=1298857 RepID=UPI000409B8D3|nr:mechanosensitive ion channel family protein [Candidatus Solirubrobacter pratensis]
MRAPDPRIAESLWHREWFSAALSLAVAFAIATAFDRVLRGRIVRVAAQRTGISREADTRLRFVRRLIYATIVLIGVAVALSYFASIGRLAASLLASGAIAAAVVGFAARQVLANFVAGIMLAITQPLRVGDWVTFEGNYGVVEDVRLNYTILRTLSDQRVVIPNERLASGVLRNDTLAIDRVALDVAVWLPPEADAERAIEVLRDETGQEASVAEIEPWGVRLAVGGDPVPPPQKAAREAELRRMCLRRLRDEGLLTV